MLVEGVGERICVAEGVGKSHRVGLRRWGEEPCCYSRRAVTRQMPPSGLPSGQENVVFVELGRGISSTELESSPEIEKESQDHHVKRVWLTRPTHTNSFSHLELSPKGRR